MGPVEAGETSAAIAQAATLEAAADTLFDESRFSEAEAKYAEAIATGAAAPTAHASRGDALGALGRVDEALACYEAAAAQAPGGGGDDDNRRLAMSFFRWAFLLVGKHDLDQARERFQWALELYGDPDTPTDSHLGSVYDDWSGLLTNLDFQEAADSAERAAELFGEETPSAGLAIAYTNWSGALTGLQNFSQAVERGKRAIALSEETDVSDTVACQAYSNLAAALLGVQDLPGAADNAAKAVERCAGTSPPPVALAMAYVNWAIALARMGQWRPAIDKLRRVAAAAGNPKPPNALLAASYLTWSGVLLNLGQVGKAADKAKLAIRFAGPDPSRQTALAYANLASALVGLQRSAEALVNARRGIELWGEADGVDPELARMYDTMADALVGLERLEEALAASERAVEIYGLPIEPEDPALAGIRLTWGDALARLGRYDEAADQYSAATEAAASYPPAHLGYARVLTALGRGDEATSEYERTAAEYEHAVAEYGKETEIVRAPGHLMWGDALDSLGSSEEALQHYRKAAGLDKDLAEAHLRVAATLHHAGRYALAVPAWQRASDAYEARIDRTGDPAVGDLQLEGLLLHEVYRDLDGAERLLYRALELAPGGLETLAALVDLHSTQAREAAATFGTAAVAGGSDESDPFGPERKRRLRFLEAKRLIDRRLDGDGDHAPELLTLGNLCLQVEDYEDAERSYQRALELLPDRPEPLLGLGLVNRQTGDVKRAVRYLSRAVAVAPDDLDARRALAEALVQDGSLSEAEVEYGRILSVTNDHTEAHLGLGSVHLEMASDDSPEAYDRAVEQFTAAIDLGRGGGRPSSARLLRSELAQVHYARGYARVQLYESSGLLKKDERLLRKALEDFREAVALDACQYAARRAAAQLRERSRSVSRERRSRTLGPMLVVCAALVVFAIAQIAFFVHLHGALRLGATNYVALTFGALLFVVAGLSLPELLRLKVGGFELEKESVVEVTEIKPLAIAKPLTVRPAPISGALPAHS